jgi:hypothetical protein
MCLKVGTHTDNSLEIVGQIQTFWALTRRQTRSKSGEKENSELNRPKFIPLSSRDAADDGHESDGDSETGSVWHDDDEHMNGSTNGILDLSGQLSSHYERLIDWQVDLFSKLLKQIVAGRNMSDVERPDPDTVLNLNCPVFEEVTDSIPLPKFDAQVARARVRQTQSVELPAEVISELRSFIRDIARGYHNNPFHSYAHASHVLQSANKLLARISRPEDVNYHRKSVKAIASDLHTQTVRVEKATRRSAVQNDTILSFLASILL